MELCTIEGDSPVTLLQRSVTLMRLRSRAVWACSSNRSYTRAKAKYSLETDSAQVLRRKDEKHFGKRVKEYVKPSRGKGWQSIHWFSVCFLSSERERRAVPAQLVLLRN